MELNSASVAYGLEEDETFFTEQEIEFVEAIEAAYELSSSFSKKRQSSPVHTHYDHHKTRRQLPGSFLSSPPSRSFSISPCKANSRMKYPVMRFGGQILYSRTSAEVEKTAMELLKILEAKKRETGQVAIGFDIEWKPTFKTGVLAGKAAVMQICGDHNHCYVMHIIHSGIPPSLQFLLEDSAILKVGVGIGNDTVKIYKDYNISVKAVDDLSYIARQRLGGDFHKWSLASLTEMLVCKELEKPKKIRLGNWEADFLSKGQLQYAATDAFASWYLYEVLKSFPDTVSNAGERTSQEVEGVPQ